MDEFSQNKSNNENIKDESEVDHFRPGGDPFMGQMTKSNEAYVSRRMKVPGLLIWYRCNSCLRSVRLDDEDKHNGMYHSKVICDKCNEVVDQFKLREHQRTGCSKNTTFCEFCSMDTTIGDLQSHYDDCPGAKEAQLQRVYPTIAPLENIHLPDLSTGAEIIDLATHISKLSINEKFPIEKIQKYKTPYGYRLFPVIQNDKNEVKNVFKDLQRRKQQQLKHEKKILNEYLKRNIPPPQENLERDRQTQILRQDTENMIKTLMVNPIRGSKKPIIDKEKAEETEKKVKQKPEKYKRRLQRIQENPLVTPEARKYTRTIHTIASKLCREKTRRYADSIRQKLNVQNFHRLHELLEQQRIQADKDWVINQAVKLELKHELLDKMKKEDRHDFILQVKASRPLWEDLGLDPEDATESNFHLSQLQQQIKNKTHLAAGHSLKSHRILT